MIHVVAPFLSAIAIAFAIFISLVGLSMVIKNKSSQVKKKQLIYLAGPYSHPDEAVRLSRFHALNKMAGKMMSLGAFVYSPISHTHPIAMDGSLPLGWDFWGQYDRVILECCSKLVVYKLIGWEDSKGVAAEIKIAKELGLPIEYVNPL